MKKVCIALDYTPFAKKVAETGFAYAKALGAETTLVHVLTEAAYYALDYVPISGYNAMLEEGRQHRLKEVQGQAQKFLSDLVLNLKDGIIKTSILEGHTADAILDFVNENKMDLIVLGTHGHSGLEKLLMGNTAARIVRHSRIPLLLVPSYSR